MSATFKNAKKKIAQTELRRFMNEQKAKTQGAPKRIDSPLAKYTDSGQLMCILCQSIVRSEAVWTIHINAKQHKENIAQAKKLKEKTNNFTTPVKRPLTPPTEVPTKKIKGILKNAIPNSSSAINNTSSSTSDAGSSITNQVPNDFFDSKSSDFKIPLQSTKSGENSSTIEKMDVQESETIPEGFFDDPKQDAKARNLEYKDPVEEEWEKFQKEMREADSKSAAIIAEDQEEATNERQIDEIDEQIKNWSRVLDLERKKEEVISTANKMDEEASSNNSSDEEVNDFDEYLDWRAKQSYK